MANYEDGGVGFGSGLDWDMTSNQGLTPLVNYNFNLQVEGTYNLPCKSVHVFHRENEYETLQEGGLNDYVHMLRKPISKPMTFQVERYVGIDMLDPLALGTDLTLPVLLLVSRYQGDGDNGVLDLSDSMQRVYTFTGCTVIAKDFGELNAERSGLLVETTTIAYREMICVDNPSTKSKRKSWSMKKDHANMERDSERKQAKSDQYGITELNKADMKARARMYVDKGVTKTPQYINDYAGKKISTTRSANGRESQIGIADKNKMAPISEREKAAKRFFMPGSTSVQSYKGTKANSATVNKDELTRSAMEKRAKKNGAVKQKELSVEEMEKLAKKGGAAKKEMKPAKNQRKYYIDGSQSKETDKYQGEIKSSAAHPAGELKLADMKKNVRKGGAKTPDKEVRKAAMEKAAKKYYLPDSKSKGKDEYQGKVASSAKTVDKETRKADLEKAARRYYLEGSTSQAGDEYKGTVRTSAKTIDKEMRKADLEKKARKGGAVTKKMEPAPVRTGGAVTKKMAPTPARKGGAKTKKMAPAKNQRRYFITGSKSMTSYSGAIRPSAAVKKDELRKPAMAARARQWPKTRSAADVAAFLKKR